jgi:hypothetical protein
MGSVKFHGWERATGALWNPREPRPGVSAGRNGAFEEGFVLLTGIVRMPSCLQSTRVMRFQKKSSSRASTLITCAGSAWSVPASDSLMMRCMA